MTYRQGESLYLDLFDEHGRCSAGRLESTLTTTSRPQQQEQGFRRELWIELLKIGSTLIDKVSLPEKK